MLKKVFALFVALMVIPISTIAASAEWSCTPSVSCTVGLALLADALDNDARARTIHQKFKSRVIVDLPERRTMTRSRILAHAKMLERLEYGR